ncbi:MAG: diguanylate cyclase [Gammaproteobacteria bacterium]|nr:diguanylate cyclase [Gammaproteobacteria bacterium]
MKLFTSERITSLTFGILFCFIVAVLAGYNLKISLQQEELKTRERISNTSFLIGEWIKGAFVASDYVLRDMVQTIPISELKYPATNPTSHSDITKYIDDKRKTLPYASGVGLNDDKCIVTHTISIVGFDASHREWCKVPKNNPDIETYVSNMFTSNNGELMVIQARRFPGDNFTGLAGIGVNLDFFSKWLNQISIGSNGVIAISDTNLSLLASKPSMPELLGKEVNDPLMSSFISSDYNHKIVSHTSPIDGIERLYGVRKINDLPFIIIVGEAYQDWQKEWSKQVWISVSAVAILWMLILIVVRDYWTRLSNLSELKKARDELEILSVTDSLTSLANRRRFNETLDIELRRLRRKKAYLSLVMIDVDYFKAFNDTYGHIVGDECLTKVAEAIKISLKRVQDLPCRYGGEEFACILPETDLESAKSIANEIRKNIETTGIKHEGSSIANHVTASLGVATINCSEPIEPQELVNLADQHLYQAKKNGRNQVI